MKTYCGIVFNVIPKFTSAEDGAISIDFVVLTSAIMLIGAVAVGSFEGEVIRVANETAEVIGSQLE